MKKVLIGILVGIVIVIVGALLLALFFTSDLTNSTDQFFSLVRDGDIEEAYQATSREFQASTSLETFQAFLANTTISDYDSASWSSRSRENNLGTLEGSIKTKNGGVIPVNILLVKEDDQWKILNIDKTEGGLVEDRNEEEGESQKKEIPSRNELIGMTTRSVMSLAEAIVDDDFTNFYNSVSKFWQSQTSANALRDIFKQFIERNIDMRGIRNVTPIYSKNPYIDDKDLLILEGYYPTTPLQVHFTLKYTYEYPEWKLFGIYVNVKAPEKTTAIKDIDKQSKALPPMNELIMMTDNSVMRLALAINKDNFSDFYNSVSKLWQSQTNTNELRNAFKEFIDKNIDLTIVRGEAPIFSDEPYLDKDELLVLKGYYASKPYAILFELKFIYEYPKWKLFSIKINI